MKQQNAEPQTAPKVNRETPMAEEVQLEEIAISMQDNLPMQDQVFLSSAPTPKWEGSQPSQPENQMNGVLEKSNQKPVELRHVNAQVGSIEEQPKEPELMVDLSAVSKDGQERPKSEIFQLSPWQSSMKARTRYTKPEKLQQSCSDEAVPVEFAATESIFQFQQSAAFNSADVKVETFKPEIQISPKRSLPAKLLTKSRDPGYPTKKQYVVEDVWEILQPTKESLQSDANPTKDTNIDSKDLSLLESASSQVQSDELEKKQVEPSACKTMVSPVVPPVEDQTETPIDNAQPALAAKVTLAQRILSFFR